MSRLEAWTDTDQMERQDVASIIGDQIKLIKQYRLSDLGDMDGFEEPSVRREHQFLRNLKGRIDRRDRVYIEHRDETVRSVEHMFIATVYGKDLKKDDILEADGMKYHVVAVNTVGQSFTEAECRIYT